MMENPGEFPGDMNFIFVFYPYNDL